MGFTHIDNWAVLVLIFHLPDQGQQMSDYIIFLIIFSYKIALWPEVYEEGLFPGNLLQKQYGATIENIKFI